MLIDVRTTGEYASGHADGATNLPLQDIMNGSMPDCSKDTEIQLYCRSGGRSEAAKDLLVKDGFTNVVNAGGVNDVM